MSNPGPELFKAMLAFQSTNPSVAKGGFNPHFGSKYITLEDLTAVARGCNAHGLVFYQYLDGGEFDQDDRHKDFTADARVLANGTPHSYRDWHRVARQKQKLKKLQI